MMEVKITERKLKKIYSDRRKMIREYGNDNAKYITKRINELEAADNLQVIHNMHTARFHSLSGNYKGMYALDIAQPLRMIIEPVFVLEEDKEKRKLEKVKKVIVRKIEDYH